jgi:branched-subunit amino acid permease
VLFQIIGFSVIVFKIMWLVQVEAMALLNSMIGAITPIFLAVLAILGYVANDSSKVKMTAMTGELPNGPLKTVGDAVRKVVPLPAKPAAPKR